MSSSQSDTLCNTQRPTPGMILYGVPKNAEALAIARLMHNESLQRVLHVAATDRDLETLAASLRFFAPEAEVIQFPAWDTLPYDRISPKPTLMAERIAALVHLIHPSTAPLIVLTTTNAILQKLPPKSWISSVSLTLKTGGRIAQDALITSLIAQGYHRTGKAMEPGEFALRGGIIDIMPAGATEGLRLDLFGDEIECIKHYDPMTQLTHGAIEQASLLPVSEVLLTPETSEHFRTHYREQFGAVSKEDPLYEAISYLAPYPGMEHWLPLFYDHTQTLFDYVPDATITLSQDVAQTLDERWEAIDDYYTARVEARKAKASGFSDNVYNPLAPDICFVMEKTWASILMARPTITFSAFVSGGNDAGFRSTIAYIQGNADHTPFDQLGERPDKPTLIACYSAGSCERLFSMLMSHGFHCLMVESLNDIARLKGKTLGLAVLPIDNGFTSDTLLIISEQDLLGERIARSTRKKKPSETFMAEAANFTEGEFIVHKEHGIGRFDGLVAIEVSGARHDCLKLVYADDDKLFLPVENIDMVTRFGLEAEGVKLDKLGGVSWQSRKARLKERITLAAEALIRIAAERQIKKAIAFGTSTGAYEDFRTRFPYAETDDQERSIEDVINDLASGKPMDRLVCGDVGFGKTEVALRAAFVAAYNQSVRVQVAVIVPTTLLARQHYKNFVQRFAGFPVVVRQLSRMVPARTQKEIREGLANGSVDIVIGTHALLAKNIAFKNLGLVIVDEEQHFGVAQKEKLKQLRSNVHILTLSATPIPRTLQMALTGVRDLSLITTPPVDRLAVRSFVMPYDPVVLREAIQREKHRGGKLFLVVPRIKDIADIRTKIAQLVPDLSIAVAHGQMAAGELDKIMNDFYDGKHDALLSTAIIESGLDIPTANTMIIFNAHLFGLAQLYQLRGRVGRGKIRAYAYFILPHHRELTKNATRRLEIMQTLDTLGAGFTLASHDMDIRGFGNLVGEEQSGHIKEVGIELYQQMLEEAVAALKQNVIPNVTEESEDPSTPLRSAKDYSPTINLGLSVLIPESYVEDLSLRLGLYRRASLLSEAKDIDSFAAELTDRFGAMPEEVKNLIAVLELKLLCKYAGIERIDTGPKGAVIAFHQNRFVNPETLLKHIERNPRTLKVRPDQKLVFTHEWNDGEDKVLALKKLANDIAALAH